MTVAYRKHVILCHKCQRNVAVKNDCTICPRCRAIRSGHV